MRYTRCMKRASHYTVRVAKQICEYIALGSTLDAALKKTGILAPTKSTFVKWMDLHPELRTWYENARQLQADCHADRMLELSESTLIDPKNASAYKVASDILRWQASIRNPKSYGDKVTHEVKQGLNPKEIMAEIARLESELGVKDHEDPKKVVSIEIVKTARGQE